MKRAAIYARVSTSDGKQDYSRQVNELTLLAKQQGFEDIVVYAEMVSGYKKYKDRPQLDKLVTKIESDNKYFQCIYTSEISRIGRNPKHTRELIDIWSEIGVPVYIQSLNRSTLGQDGKRDAIMNIILQVLIEYADLESQTFKSRSKSGVLKSVQDGKAGGGAYLPYGYKKDKKKMLVIAEDEAKVIIQIFDLYKKGSGIKVISHILNEQKVPTRSDISYKDKTIKFKIPKNTNNIIWSDKQVHDILKNPIYKGDRRFKGEIFSAPAVISTELFDECTEIRKNKTTRNITTTYTYLLKDLMVCGKCGRNYFARYKPIQNGDKVYKCSSTLIQGGSCGNCGVNISLIESVLYSDIVQSELVLKYLNNRQGIITDLESSIKKLKQQISIDESFLKNKDKEVDRVLNLHIKGKMLEHKYDEKIAEIGKRYSILSEKVVMAKKDLKSKGKTLDGLKSNKTTKEMLINAKNDRNELQGIFKQMIHKIIFNKIDIDTGLLTMYLKVNGEVLSYPVKLLLDLHGVKMKPMVYQYMSMFNMECEPVYDNNILLEDVSEIKEEFLKCRDWEQIENKYFLSVS